MNLLKPTHLKRVVFFIGIDLLISLFTLYLAYELRFNFHVPEKFFRSFFQIYILLSGLKIFTLAFFQIYFVPWRFFGLQEAKKLLLAHVISYTLFAAIFMLFYDTFSPFARSILLMDMLLSYLFIGAIRISKRIYVEKDSRISSAYPPALIIGANSKTSNIIKAFLNGDLNYYPVAVIDDKLKGANFSNLQVYGFSELEKIIEKEKITVALLTQDYASEELNKLFETLRELGIEEIKLAQIVGDKEKLKDIAIEDLLARHPKDLDVKAIGDFVNDKIVMITGAGGSIGSEIARQCQHFGAKKLILLDHSEFNLYQIVDQLQGIELIPVMSSVLNRSKLDEIMQEYQPELLLHAAAYKHVPLCEANKMAAIENNVLGTKNLIDAAVRNKIKKLVIISTDKAVRPTNVMGATKRVTELYGQNVGSKDTEIVAVRFGNVLGSSGSVIPKFKAQIEAGGPITITDPEITRYFMLIPEACQLVLQAGAMANGGELFVLDMGESVKIVDLAQKMLQLSGKENEIEIEFIGLRPGEKLYEELLISDEEKKTQYESIFIANPTPYDIHTLEDDIKALVVDKDKVKALQKIVPEFEHRG